MTRYSGVRKVGPVGIIAVQAFDQPEYVLDCENCLYGDWEIKEDELEAAHKHAEAHAAFHDEYGPFGNIRRLKAVGRNSP